MNVDIAIGEYFIEQMRQYMNLMQEACSYIPWEQCPNCPFYLECEKLDKKPMDWEENVK